MTQLRTLSVLRAVRRREQQVRHLLEPTDAIMYVGIQVICVGVDKRNQQLGVWGSYMLMLLTVRCLVSSDVEPCA